MRRGAQSSESVASSARDPTVGHGDRVVSFVQRRTANRSSPEACVGGQDVDEARHQLAGARAQVRRRDRGRAHRQRGRRARRRDPVRSATSRRDAGRRRVGVPCSIRSNATPTAGRTRSSKVCSRASCSASMPAVPEAALGGVDEGELGADDHVRGGPVASGAAALEAVEVGRVEEAATAVRRGVTNEQPAAHVGVQRRRLHAEAGCGLGGREECG